jgi:hypothetical protein
VRPARRAVSIAVLALAMAAGPAHAAAPKAGAATTGPPVTAPEQAPWSVYITLDPSDSPRFCSGSILDASHILTAAHCTRDESGRTVLPATAYQVYAGLVRDDASSANDRFQQRGVAVASAHPYYSNDYSNDDVAVLTLSAPLTLTPGIQPIPLAPIGTRLASSTSLLVVGWGATGSGYDVFQHAVVIHPVVRASCSTGYSGTLCAGAAKAAVCPGDSGSGLVQNAFTNRALVGVDSFGGSSDHCELGVADGYADLASPEIGLWLRGVPNPPRGPRTQGEARVVAHRGHRVSCRPPHWAGKPRLKAAFFLSGRSDPVYVGRHRYHVPKRSLRRRVTCLSIASNRNGTAQAASLNHLRLR